MQRLTPDHLRMPRDADLDETAVDDAIRVAAARTRTAQDAVADEIAEEHQPGDELTETVVDRAADLKDLAQEALDEPGASPDGPPANLR
jgi:hypothetical protein